MLTASAVCQTDHTGLVVIASPITACKPGFRRRGAIRQSQRAVGYADRGHATSHAAAGRDTTGTGRATTTGPRPATAKGRFRAASSAVAHHPPDDDDEVVRRVPRESRCNAPTRARSCAERDRGVTSGGRDTFKMAEKLHSDDIVPTRGSARRRAKIECPEVASARVATWTSRVAKPTMTQPREAVPNLEAAVRAGNVADMTASFLALCWPIKTSCRQRSNTTGSPSTARRLKVPQCRRA